MVHEWNDAWQQERQGSCYQVAAVLVCCQASRCRPHNVARLCGAACPPSPRSRRASRQPAAGCGRPRTEAVVYLIQSFPSCVCTNREKLLEDLEIRYLANRSPNLYFGLLTDFTDADLQETANDSVLELCVGGIGRLNARFGTGQSGPFYLFHRARLWNASAACP